MLRAPSPMVFITSSTFQLRAYTDSNWAGDSTNRRSTSGYYVCLGSNLISWSSKKQSTISCSSTEAEYRPLAHTAAEVTWLQMLLADFSIPQPSLIIWCDNQSALSLWLLILSFIVAQCTLRWIAILFERRLLPMEFNSNTFPQLTNWLICSPSHSSFTDFHFLLPS